MASNREATRARLLRRAADGWIPSARPDVSIRPDADGHLNSMNDYRLERALEPSDIETLPETAAWMRKSTQTLVNWKKRNPGFPLSKMGGRWVVIRPFLDAFLLHELS